jgi:peptide chain release factor 1
MFTQLENLRGKFFEVGKSLSDPGATTDMKRFAQLNREYRELEKVVKVFDAYKLVLGNIETNKQILNTESDEEFRDMAKSDLTVQEAEKEKAGRRIEAAVGSQRTGRRPKRATGDKSRHGRR